MVNEGNRFFAYIMRVAAHIINYEKTMDMDQLTVLYTIVIFHSIMVVETDEAP